jgi:RimJ/RimL family protein N-acetyltransferase
MQLETERLILRPWQADDSAALHKYASDPRIGPMAGWPPHSSIDESAQVIATILSSAETYAVTVRSTGEPIGSVGLTFGSVCQILQLNPNEAEIGYWVAVPYWGQGIATEAVKALLRHAFEDLLLDAVWCGHYDCNQRSQRVQEKCGFRHQRTEAEVLCAALGEYRAVHLSCLRRDQYLSRSAI